MTRFYGNIINRLEECKNFLGRDIQVGDNVTSYSWSDRHPYYITQVIDQHHIFVKKYSVCADHDKAGGMGHQDWMYFKTRKEENEYLNAHGFNRKYDGYEDPEEEWIVYRNHWHKVLRWTREKLETLMKEDEFKALTVEAELGEKKLAKLYCGKEVAIYKKLNSISFVKEPDYYYDWEF